MQRWYDKDPRIIDALDIIKELPDEVQEELAKSIINFVNLLRESNRYIAEPSLSIGKNKVLGLYKSSQKRRWYDSSPALMSAMNVVSTLDIEDFKSVTEGILLTLKELQEKQD